MLEINLLKALKKGIMPVRFFPKGYKKALEELCIEKKEKCKYLTNRGEYLYLCTAFPHDKRRPYGKELNLSEIKSWCIGAYQTCIYYLQHGHVLKN